MNRKSAAAALLLIPAFGASALAYIGTGYQLFGAADYVSPGNNSNRAVKLTAEASGQGFSGVSFGVPAGLAINDLTQLSTDYHFAAGSSCGVGTPRFGIQLAGHAGTIFVYIGPPPNYTGCPTGVWSNTANLLAPASLVDSSQVGGAFYEPWATTQARLSGANVSAVFVVSDTGGGPQTVTVDNTNVNGISYDYEFESKEDCKKGGWKNFTFAPGPFKNQGQCVSHFAKEKS
jgi:hypothetical protein